MGGLAALYSLGVSHEVIAKFISGHIAGAGGVSSWADWDETSEAGLATSNTFVCFLENASSGTNEIGQGAGLAESDRTLTQSGNIAGATGSPPSRLFDGSDDLMAMTVNLSNLLAGGGNWTIITKIKVVSNNATEAPFAFYGAQDHIYAMFNGSGNILFRCQKDTVNKINVTSTDAMTMNQIGYIGLWYDGTYIRGGFIDGGSPTPNTKPTKWSDFNANDRVSATDTITWIAGDFDGTKYLGGYFSASYALQCYIYYIVISNTCLIDNGS